MEQKKLYRSKENRMILGVCAGIAKYFNVDPTLVRVGAVVAACISSGGLIIAYLIGAALIPEED